MDGMQVQTDGQMELNDLKTFNSAYDAAVARDNYIIDNNLPHKLCFAGKGA